MTSTLLIALTLMLVLEGVMPFIARAAWRQTFRRLIQFSDGQMLRRPDVDALIGLILLMLFS